jgi:shikimate dehydrogenase
MNNGHTLQLWILGHPVAQTVSPGLFNAAFAAAQENYCMQALDVPPAQLAQALALLRDISNLRGCLLTIPHKLPALQYIDVLSERSRALGLVNIIRKTPLGLEGDALDGQGFVGALARHGLSPLGQQVLVIGCGGAGAASAWDALDAGASCVGIYDVNPKRLQQMRQVLAQRFGAARVTTFFSLPSKAVDWQIVLNTSPLGMRLGDALPISLDALATDAVIVDATTPPEPSRWLSQAAARGHRVIHGPEFTRGQLLAMASFFGLSSAVTHALSQL